MWMGFTRLHKSQKDLSAAFVSPMRSQGNAIIPLNLRFPNNSSYTFCCRFGYTINNREKSVCHFVSDAIGAKLSASLICL